MHTQLEIPAEIFNQFKIKRKVGARKKVGNTWVDVYDTGTVELLDYEATGRSSLKPRAAFYVGHSFSVVNPGTWVHADFVAKARVPWKRPKDHRIEEFLASKVAKECRDEFEYVKD